MASISKRASGAWQNTSYGIRGTATDTITTLPTTIYSDGTNATVSIKGNTVQSGTPTPYNTIMLEGCGELEAGQYKIPILSNSTTTPIYLGEVETTRKVEKYECTGDENWQFFSESTDRYGTWQFFVNGLVNGMARTSAYSNIAGYGVTAETRARYQYGVYLVTSGTGIGFQMAGAKDTFTGITAWKSYLQQQYAAGTPVTVWYVLAEPTTGIVNEPLMKIEDYADVVNNISIPTTDGANALSVDTTVQPSEVSVNYHGWHMGTVHERTAGHWD